jgi:hypothetical protein
LRKGADDRVALAAQQIERSAQYRLDLLHPLLVGIFCFEMQKTAIEAESIER